MPLTCLSADLSGAEADILSGAEAARRNLFQKGQSMFFIAEGGDERMFFPGSKRRGAATHSWHTTGRHSACSFLRPGAGPTRNLIHFGTGGDGELKTSRVPQVISCFPSSFSSPMTKFPFLTVPPIFTENKYDLYLQTVV